MKHALMILALLLPLVLPGICFDSLEHRYSAQVSNESFLIDPWHGVGHIVPGCSEIDLIKFYGAKNVRYAAIEIGEGETAQGSILFPGTLDAVAIEWKQTYSQPERITISSRGTRWHTQEGITIGTSLDQLEVINGRPFKLTGFCWDYEGRTVSWEKGRLSQQLQLDLRPTKDVSESEFETVLGDRYFSSSFPAMKKLGLVVEKIFVRWD